MAAAGDISHNPNVASLAPPTWVFLGENVGFGPTCDSVGLAFMSSPDHLKNILAPSYSSVGVGVVDGPDGLIYVTEDFMGIGATSVQAASGPAPRPVEAAAPVPVALSLPPPPRPVAEPATPAAVAVPIPNPPSVPAPRPIPAPAPKPPAPPPGATAVAVPVALPIMDPAQVPGGVAAPRVGLSGLQKGILGGIVNALDAFFAH